MSLLIEDNAFTGLTKSELTLVMETRLKRIALDQCQQWNEDANWFCAGDYTDAYVAHAELNGVAYTATLGVHYVHTGRQKKHIAGFNFSLKEEVQ